MTSKIDQLLTFAASQKASDIVLSSGSSPYVRLNGEFTRVNMPALGASAMKHLLGELLSPEQSQKLLDNTNIDPPCPGSAIAQEADRGLEPSCRTRFLERLEAFSLKAEQSGDRYGALKAALLLGQLDLARARPILERLKPGVAQPNDGMQPIP